MPACSSAGKGPTPEARAELGRCWQAIFEQQLQCPTSYLGIQVSYIGNWPGRDDVVGTQAAAPRPHSSAQEGDYTADALVREFRYQAAANDEVDELVHAIWGD